MRRSLALLVCCAIALFGCTSSSESTQNVSRFQIEVDEIKGSSARTAFGLIRQHRPSWFRESDRDHSAYARGTRQIGFVVYVDGQRYGEGSSALSSITTARVHQIDYLDASEALSQHGRGHEEGAIHIVTRYRAAQEKEN